MKYFENIEDLQTLKEKYRKLVKKFHPDNNLNDLENANKTMQIINTEFEKAFKELSNIFYKEKKVNKSDIDLDSDYQEFIKAINKLINIENIKIEIIGTWLWVSGETREIKELLKELNFKYASKKQMWSLSPKNYKCRNRKEMTYEDITNRYGSKEVVKKDNKKIACS